MISNNSLPSISQGRVLAMILPSLTLLSHLLVLPLAISYTPSISFSSAASWFSFYNMVVIIASIAGLIGTLRSNSALISIYTIVHSVTLLILTLTLCTVFLPTDSTFLHPLLSSGWLNERRFCTELDGFGANEQWIVTCVARLSVLKWVMVCAAVVMLAVQWWAVLGVWQWGRALESNGKDGEMRQVHDVEEQKVAVIEHGHGDEKEERRRVVKTSGYSEKMIGS